MTQRLDSTETEEWTKSHARSISRERATRPHLEVGGVGVWRGCHWLAARTIPERVEGATLANGPVGYPEDRRFSVLYLTDFVDCADFLALWWRLIRFAGLKILLESL